MKMSRIVPIVAAATFSLANAAWSAEKMADMPSMKTTNAAAPAAAPTHTATGLVKKVDLAGSKVVIAHGAIKTLGWPAMTMSFIVKDKALFKKLAVGKTVEFKLANEGNEFVVVAVK
jgi:Cu(I)/Ag(I) efflux system protein CusF